MIDIHTHILTGLDDGAEDVATALAMARLAVADGVNAVVATPHSIWDGVTEERVKEQLRFLEDTLVDAGIALRLIPGIEVWLVPDLPAQQQAGRAFPINNGPYMLIELPLQQMPGYVDQSLFDLQLTGIRPILAHPERYAALQGNLEPLFNWVCGGILCQITASSLLGGFGHKAKEMAELMLRHNLAHVIASDAHSAEARPPLLSRAARRAAELIGAERAAAMVNSVPAKIVAGEAVHVPEPLPYRPKRRWLPWGG